MICIPLFPSMCEGREASRAIDPDTAAAVAAHLEMKRQATTQKKPKKYHRVRAHRNPLSDWHSDVYVVRKSIAVLT